jgi:hypothetical protein
MQKMHNLGAGTDTMQKKARRAAGLESMETGQLRPGFGLSHFKLVCQVLAPMAADPTLAGQTIRAALDRNLIFFPGCEVLMNN